MTGAYSGNEKLICDTSFVGHLARRGRSPERYERWGEAAIDRVDAGEPAVSVVTVAETRAGYLNAGCGRARMAEIERQLGRFRWLPIRRSHVDEWARLRVAARTRGIAISHNDLWIAAKASIHAQVLVTCDRDHLRLAPDLPAEVLFLAPPV
ncbi:MAG: type II toxin-antitoxin system VapC family toxin [Actinobacteria bacterium]|nr:type II toxin-antitoxin system VapC family toxin [Actinomycetota bacterium]